MHFLVHCDALKDERSDLFKEAMEQGGYMIEGSEIELMKKLFNKRVLKIMGKHVITMMERRRNLLYEDREEGNPNEPA